jgi:30S ribosomal protein S31
LGRLCGLGKKLILLNSTNLPNPPKSLDCLYLIKKISRHLQNKKTIMGRGDKKTKKGKIFKGSFGKSRPATEKKTTGNQPAKKSS